MKNHLKRSLIALALLTALGLIPVSRVTAQTFTNLYIFTYSSDGAGPWGGLILSGNTLYGTAESGGANDGAYDYGGTVFALNTDGTGFTNLCSFDVEGEAGPSFTNSPGVFPNGLTLSGNTLYGTAEGGGTNATGTVFALNTNGTGFTVLHTFTAMSAPYYQGGTNSDGAGPTALISSGNTLYGTADGGPHGRGTVFALNTNGTEFTVLHAFSAVAGPSSTNSDGVFPNGLILSGNTLYGTAQSGGPYGWGTVFALNTNGTGFTVLHAFSAVAGPSSTNSDGAQSTAGLILSGNTLYGTAEDGGAYGWGTVFALNTNGTGFTTLYSFTHGSDGGEPQTGLTISDGTLYGTTAQGGTNGYGAVFALNTNGAFTALHSFNGGSDGADPQTGLVLSGNTLYGTTWDGSTYDAGTVFALSLAGAAPVPIPLNIQLISNGVVLSWTNAGFTLQSAPVVTGTFTNIPGATSPYTNPVTGAQQFFRLLAP